MDKIKEKPQATSSIREKIKTAPKGLVHRGLEDGTDRLRTQLRDAAQQGRRDDHGGDQIEDTTADSMRRMERFSLRRNGRTVPPATAVPRIPPLGIPRRRSVHGSMKAVSTPQRQTSRRNRSEKPGSGSRPRTHTCALKRKRRFPACHQSAPRASNPSSGSAGGRQRRSPRRTESSGCVSQQAAGKSLCNL